MEEFEYPMWFKDTESNLTVRFDSLTGGECIVSGIDYKVGHVFKENDFRTWERHDSGGWINVTDQYKPKEMPKCIHDVPLDSECGECMENAELIKAGKERSFNNGGKIDYYQLKSAPFPINDFDDFAEWRNMNGNQFNIGKVMWTFNVGRHSGTCYERDLNKIIHYAQRELLRIKRDCNLIS